MRSHLPVLAALAAALILAPGFAHAYIGPGLGAGAIAAVLGVLGAIFLALFSVIYYPIKRMRKKKKAAAEAAQTTTPPEE